MEPRYKLVSERGFSQGSEIVDLKTGEALHGVRSISLHLRVDEMVTADIQLLGVCTYGAEIGKTAFLIADPFKNDHRPVRRVEYEDGSGFEVVSGYLTKFDAQR